MSVKSSAAGVVSVVTEPDTLLVKIRNSDWFCYIGWCGPCVFETRRDFRSSLDLQSLFRDVVVMSPERAVASAKNHWYDGTFFDLCVAPNQDPVFAAVRAVIEPGSTVLDVGCGTGRLVFQLASHCRMVCGIDPSSRNINRARALYRRQGSPSHLSFESASLGAYLSHFRERYDIGVISFVLHEVEETARVPMLQMLSGAVRTVILADYRVPRRRRLADAATEVVEFVAGIEHYRGFRSFIRRGGLTELVREAGLRNLGEQPCSQRTAQVLRAAGTVP